MCSGPIILNNSNWVSSKKESTSIIFIDNSASLGVNKSGTSFFDSNISLVTKILNAFDGVTNLKVYQTNPPKLIYDDFIDEGIKVDPQDFKIKQSMGSDNLWSFIDSVLQDIDNEFPNKE